jgi:hypothetical protein
MQWLHYVQRLVGLRKVPARTSSPHICFPSYSLSDQPGFVRKALITVGNLGTSSIAVNGQGLYLCVT